MESPLLDLAAAPPSPPELHAVTTNRTEMKTSAEAAVKEINAAGGCAQCMAQNKDVAALVGGLRPTVRDNRA